MRNKVRSWCQSQHLTAPGDRVVCAVSGGADSVALLRCMLELQSELGLQISAAHFNHQLRGAESDRDEAFVRQLCKGWRVPLTVGHGDVSARAAATGESLEEAGRTLRYAFFDTLDGKIATAHTADDNLETILLNLLRGSSLKGLAGIPPNRGRFFRPLLPVSRREVEDYLDAAGISHVEDSSNASDAHLRNRLRHSVIPLLKQENPSLAEAALRSGLLLRQDDAYLDMLAQTTLDDAACEGGFLCEPLRQLPSAVRSRAVRLLLQPLHVPKLSASHIAAVDALLDTENPSARCDLPGGWCAQRQYERLLLLQTGQSRSFAPVFLPVPGQAVLPELGLKISAIFSQNCPALAKNSMVFACSCDRINSAQYAICVRPRQSGDTLRLPGGTRTLKRLFIDRKIPASQRGLAPVFADARGVLAVYPLGVNLDRSAVSGMPAVIITIEKEEGCHYD